MTDARGLPSVSLTTARTGTSTEANELAMRLMQECAYAKRGEQYLLIKSPTASGKSRALMFVALDKLRNQGLKQAVIVVPERSPRCRPSPQYNRHPTPHRTPRTQAVEGDPIPFAVWCCRSTAC